MYLVTALSHSIIMPLSIEFDIIKFLEKKKKRRVYRIASIIEFYL